MITSQLTDPQSIVVVGASNNLAKPGGKIYHNIKKGSFKGKLIAVNPKEDEIQGDVSCRALEELPKLEMAILAIPAKFCVDSVELLASKKGVKAFIIISAGFSEENEEGADIEKKIVEVCNRYGASLIGPNCIGVMTPGYQGVFTEPIPKLDSQGCDFISGSGATAVFIMEAGLQKGLKFSSVYSVGNSAQLGVEDVLASMDESYLEGKSSKVKILYFEAINDPDKLLKHASSLIRKGCRIAAIKAGTSEAGSRAASSHTGAMASSDVAVDALFRKAGIIRCYGREELATVAAVLLYPSLPGNNYAIITHAGGPAVMLTDALAEGGLEVPHLEGKKADELLESLYAGSSVANPIDVLATGTAEQVGTCLRYCEEEFDEIDGVVLIFGTPGLFEVYDVYEVLHEHMKVAKKPVYPVLPSVTTAANEVAQFLSYGRMNFPDEVLLGQALVKVSSVGVPSKSDALLEGIDLQSIRAIVDTAEDGYLEPQKVQGILDAAGIPTVKEAVCTAMDATIESAHELAYPVVMKVVGPVHKTDVGGVVLGIQSDEELIEAYLKMEKIEGFEGVLLQQMISGMELFIGASKESNYGHVVMCGLGGIYVEALKDIQTGLAPICMSEAVEMIRSLRSYKLLEGVRGQSGIDVGRFAEIIVRLSQVLSEMPRIAELDMNPLLATEDAVIVVDARIRID